VRSSPLKRSGMDHTVFYTANTHHTCLYLVSVHKTAPPLTSGRLISAYYSFIDLKRMKDWVGLVSCGRFTHINGYPSAAGRCRSWKVRRSETDVLPLSYTTKLYGFSELLVAYTCYKRLCFTSYIVIYCAESWRGWRDSALIKSAQAVNIHKLPWAVKHKL